MNTRKITEKMNLINSKLILSLSLMSLIALFTLAKPSSAQLASLDFQIIDNINWGNGQITAAAVTETYNYNQATDTVTINYQFDQIGFAPLPPMLAIAYNYGFPITVNQPVTDTGYNSEFGPLLGVQDTDNYSVAITGLGKYVLHNRVIGSDNFPIELQQELEAEVDQILQAGHLAPGLVLSNVPGASGGSKNRGHMYWYNPGETLYFLSEILPLLSSAKQTQVLAYLQTERNSYPPELIKSLPFDIGEQRQLTDYKTDTLVTWWYNRYVYFRTHGDPKIWNLYGLAKYYEAMGELPDQTVINQATNIVNQEMNYRDWATMYWQFPHWPEYNAVHSVNQLFAGLVGYIKLARMAGDQSAEDLGWGLLARMAILRYSMGKYTQFQYDTDQFIIDPDNCGSTNQSCIPDPDWWVEIVTTNHNFWDTDENNWNGGPWWAHLTTQNWTRPIDNVRQIHKLDNNGIDVWEWFGWGQGTGTYDGGPDWDISDGQDKSDWWHPKLAAYLLPFADITPELGYFLKDYLQPEMEVFYHRVEENLPHWYMSYAEPAVGREQGFAMPIDSYGLFMSQAWVLDERPDKLERYIDVSWLETGDLFYIQKLAETIKAYRGWCWSEDGVNCVSASTYDKGDVNHSGSVDSQDALSILTNFLLNPSQVSNYFDPVGDMIINSLDFGFIFRDWGN